MRCNHTHAFSPTGFNSNSTLETSIKSDRDNSVQLQIRNFSIFFILLFLTAKLSTLTVSDNGQKPCIIGQIKVSAGTSPVIDP